MRACSAQVRPPMPPRFFFVIDVSYVAANSGALPVICAAIKDSLDRLPGGERTQVGFLTFDSTLHFYNLAARLSQPQMMVRFMLCHAVLHCTMLSCRSNWDCRISELPRTVADGRHRLSLPRRRCGRGG